MDSLASPKTARILLHCPKTSTARIPLHCPKTSTARIPDPTALRQDSIGSFIPLLPAMLSKGREQKYHYWAWARREHRVLSHTSGRDREKSKYSWVIENLRSLKFQASYQARLNGTLTCKQASGFSLRPGLDNKASTFTGNWQGNFKWIQFWERNTRYIFKGTPDMLSQGQFLESDGQSMKTF